MANNNHKMEDIRKILNVKLLSQPFHIADNLLDLQKARDIAEMYVKLEGGIAVLSDLKSRKSYIYQGSLAEKIGLKSLIDINSIWEDELLNLIHPDDLKKKYTLELHLFKLLNTMEVEHRAGYEVVTKLRVHTKNGKVLSLKHRIIYMNSTVNGNICLVLCLYNLILEYAGFDAPDGIIIDRNSGKIISHEGNSATKILSVRESEILKLIKSGYRSIDIAQKLSLSIHTVNRHRQNIFFKLNVTNAMEACKMAETLDLI